MMYYTPTFIHNQNLSDRQTRVEPPVIVDTRR